VGTIAPKKSGWISHWRISDEKSCVKWNLAHTSRIHSSYHHTCLAISPNGQYLATGTVENTIAIFDLTFSKLMEVKRHTSFITKIMFSEDSKIILSVAADSSFVCQKIEDKSIYVIYFFFLKNPYLNNSIFFFNKRITN
jgi:WD40 repeat protein